MADSVGEVMGESRPVRHRIRSGVVVAATLCVAVLAGCAARPPLPDVGNQSPVDRSGYRVLAGVEQLYVLGALTGDAIEVRDGTDVVGGGTVDRLGSLAVRGLHQGRTYTVLNVTSGDSRPARILRAEEHPPQSFYDSTVMHEGLNYIPMRDGFTLAATVRPPLGLSLADGPFPTVIEYSGYQVAAPGDPLLNKLGGLFGLPRDPMAPGGETDVGSLLVRLAGFATVSVQIRGSGCSGGESDLFDLPTNLDGYGAIETVATQPWVSNGVVGMVGISFSGFSQIGVAATHPRTWPRSPPCRSPATSTRSPIRAASSTTGSDPPGWPNGWPTPDRLRTRVRFRTPTGWWPPTPSAGRTRSCGCRPATATT